MGEWSNFFRYWGVNEYTMLGNTLLGGLLAYVSFIVLVYCSLAIGQIACFQKHRVAIAFVAFLFINIIIGWFTSVVSWAFPDDMSPVSIMVCLNVMTLCIIVVLFEITHFILGKHLNLE